MNNPIALLKATAIVQILTGLVHAMSFLAKPSPQNDEEKQLFTLVENYVFDMGAGFHRTMGDLISVLSAHFSLAFILAGLINWFLATQRAPIEILKGVIGINLLIFGISAILNVLLAFLPPITLTVITFLLVIVTRISLSKQPA